MDLPARSAPSGLCESFSPHLGPPDPLAPWVLDAANLGPWAYQEWKRWILHIDHNWRTRKAEQGGAKVTEWKQQAKTNTTLTTKGSQQQDNVLEKKMGTGTIYGGAGKPMEIDAVHAKAFCFGCGQIGHFKRDCPKHLKTEEEAL